MIRIFLKTLSLIIISLSGFSSFAQKGLTNIQSLKQEKDALVFFVIGDWGRNGDSGQTAVANSMKIAAKQLEPEFVISTGDNFYTYGVASVNDPQWMRSFEDVYASNALQIDWNVVLGNHDYRGNAQAQVDYTNISRKWRMPSRYFTNQHELKSGKKVRFVYLDTNPFIKKYHKEKDNYGDLAKQDTTAQKQWLDSVLAVSPNDINIVVGHHPVYSTSSKHGNTPEMIATLKPMLDKYNVSAYICGHDHDLQHQQPQGSKVDYFVSGAGSEVREVPEKETMTKFAQNKLGFAIVSVTDKLMTVYFVDTNQNILYQYSKNISN